MPFKLSGEFSLDETLPIVYDRLWAAHQLKVWAIRSINTAINEICEAHYGNVVRNGIANLSEIDRVREGK